MRKLTSSDLVIGIEDLFGLRKADLELSAIGKVYAPQLAAQLTRLEELPDRNGSRVHAEELSETDIEHDALGLGIDSYLEAVLVTPGVSEAAREAARRVRWAFLPNRSALQESYAEEAARAKKNRPKLAERAEDLKLLPTPDGKTLLDWLTAFLDCGDRLDQLLSDRASTEADTASKPATELRVKTLGLLRRLREALRDEVASNPALPRDLESRVFAYLDELDARRRDSKKKTDAPPG